MAEQLRECPFCGGEAELVDEHGFAAVECISCDYLICESAVSEPIEEHWNTRAPDPSHADLVAALEPFAKAYAKYRDVYDGFYVSGDTWAERAGSESERDETAEEAMFEFVCGLGFEVFLAAYTALTKAGER